MSIVELGALGEFIGAFGVVFSLIYLATQIRQNTRSMDENRRANLAQTYQVRAHQFFESQGRYADSDHIAPIEHRLIVGDEVHLEVLETLSPLEKNRVEVWQSGVASNHDALFYQYQQGFLDEEYYESSAKAGIRLMAPLWDVLGVRDRIRPSFNAEIDRVLAEGP